MARILNYCVGPTEERLSDDNPDTEYGNGGALCNCGEEIKNSYFRYRKAGATPEIE